MAGPGCAGLTGRARQGKEAEGTWRERVAELEGALRDSEAKVRRGGVGVRGAARSCSSLSPCLPCYLCHALSYSPPVPQRPPLRGEGLDGRIQIDGLWRRYSD
jgi:hypothetical protein